MRSLAVLAEMRNRVFVRVGTDQSGLFDWDESDLEWKTRSVVGVIDYLASLILGRDSREIEKLVRMMKRHRFRRPGLIGRSAAPAFSSPSGTSSTNLSISVRGGCSAGSSRPRAGLYPPRPRRYARNNERPRRSPNSTSCSGAASSALPRGTSATARAYGSRRR
jgi:hypothetical protein